jgi:autotransporter-associated beta strand protein
MKTPTSVLCHATVLCLGLLLALPAQAVLTHWNPQGTNAANPYPGDLSGTWEDPLWSTNTAGQDTPQVWVEGTAAGFAVHTGLGTPAFTVTMNADHTVAGVFNGVSTTGNACDVTIKGTGTMIVPGTLQGFDASNSGDDVPGILRFNVPLTGPAGLVIQGDGQLFFHGANSYAGGTFLGHSSSVWSGTLNFSNSDAFSTGPIIITKSGGTLALEGAAPVTLANAVISTNTPATNVLHLVGNPAGLTFSGPWDLGATTRIGCNGAGNVVILSGPISGAGALSKFGPGTLVLAGANTYTGPTTNAEGILSLSADENLGVPSSAGRSYALVLGNHAALNATASFTLQRDRGLTLLGNAFVGAAAGQTLTVAGDIAGDYGLTITNTGIVVLTGANSYTGPTTNLAGTLNFTADYNLGALPVSPRPAALVLGRHAALNATVNCTLSPNRGLTLLGEAFLGADVGEVLTCSGVISGAHGLTVTNFGIVVLTAANTYTGPTVVKAGTLAFGAGGSLGASPLTVAADATLQNATPATATIGATTKLEAGALAVFTAVGGAAATVGKMSIAGDLVLNNNALTLDIGGAALQPGIYRLMDCTGTLSGAAAPALGIGGIPLPNGYTAEVISVAGLGGHVDLLIKATPTFTGLSANPSVTYGATNLTLAGRLSASGPISPAQGETISVTINGTAQSATLDATGEFSLSYNLSVLTANGSGYAIIYSYPGNALLNPAADTSSVLMVKPAPLTVTANDATRGYSEPNPAFTGTLVGVVNGDVITATNLCSATAASVPGHYPIVPTLLDPDNRLGNYAVTTNNGTLRVTCQTIAVGPTNSTLPNGVVGVAYSQALTAAGGLGDCTFALSSGTTPPGLNLSLAGALNGTPTAAGTNVFTVTATDTNGCSGSQTYTVVVGIAPSIVTQPVSQTNVVATTALFTVTVAGSEPFVYQWQCNGTNLTDDVRLSGSQSNSLSLSNLCLGDAGRYTVVVGNAFGSVTSTQAVLTVQPATPSFAWLRVSPSITYGDTNLTLTGSLSAEGPVYPAPGETITVTINGNAQSTTVNDNSGGFSLVYNPAALPVAATAYTITYSYAGDAALSAATNTATALTVTKAPLSVIPNNVVRGYGEPNPALTARLLGVVNGDAITAANTCSATPASLPGGYLIVPTLLDPDNRLGNYSVSARNGLLIVACPAITLSPTNAILPAVTAGLAYSQSLTATGRFGGYSFAVTSGRTPVGVNLSVDGALSGTPWMVGTNVFTVTATDTNGCSSSRTYTLVVLRDTTPPAIAITSPANGLVVNNPGVRITGTASDDVAVASVLYKLNGSSWSPVATTDGGAHWTVNLTLAPGTNVFSVYGLDTSSNASPVCTWYLTYAPLSPLTLLVQGEGTVTPNLNGQLLGVGQTYTLTAVPGQYYVFSNWTGGVSASTPALTFTMQSNLVLQANFVRGHFVPLKGTYAGLFYETNRVVPASSGTFTLTTTTNRRFSGSLQVAGARYSLRGLFDTNGTAEAFVTTRKPNTLHVALQMDLNPGADRLSGTVSDGTWTAALAGDRAVFDGKKQLAPQMGAYTLVIPGSDNEPLEPCGNGYGTVSVGKDGRVRLAGMLADGTKVSQAAMVSKHGQWPLYLSLYGQRGLLLGWLAFTNDTAATLDLEGDLDWLKPNSAGKYYPAGFLTQSLAVGARWVAPGKSTDVLAFPNAAVVLSGGNLDQTLTNAFLFGLDHKVYDASGNDVRLKFTLSSGAFTGSLLDPVTEKRISFGGVLLQKLNRGYGCFLGPNQSGTVYLGR